MFRESLLESSPALRKRTRWSMATAFTAQSIVAALLIIVPMISTGVIPLPSHATVIAPTFLKPVEVVKPPTNITSEPRGPRLPVHSDVVTLVDTSKPLLAWGPPRPPVTGAKECVPSCPVNPYVGGGDGNSKDMPNLGDYHSTPPKHVRPIISQPSEAMLLHKVVPVYPTIALHAGIQGEVKLHAIIARDGAMQSLEVISGHVLLAQAALEAVRQWQYRPYMLNGERIEVETFITVSFKKNN